MATATQIANNIATLSPEHRIIRYVVKMWRNRDNQQWLNDTNVRKVLVGGELNVARVRQHFIDRGIVTGEEFDAAIQRGVQAGVLTADLRTVGAQLIQVADILDARQEAESAAQLEARKAEWAQSLIQNP